MDETRASMDDTRWRSAGEHGGVAEVRYSRNGHHEGVVVIQRCVARGLRFPFGTALPL